MFHDAAEVNYDLTKHFFVVLSLVERYVNVVSKRGERQWTEDYLCDDDDSNSNSNNTGTV